MSNFHFQTIDWNLIPQTEQKGETGISTRRTLQLDGLRIRRVDYSKGYLADHWCQKGHIVHCLDGEFVSELENGQRFVLKQGMTYVVSDTQILFGKRSEAFDNRRRLFEAIIKTPAANIAFGAFGKPTLNNLK
jgi:hypothetical protein